MENILPGNNSGSRCNRNETINIEIFIKSRNGDRKIMQPIKITRSSTIIKNRNQSSQFKSTSSKIIPIKKRNKIPL